jgi:hypothetical protein
MPSWYRPQAEPEFRDVPMPVRFGRTFRLTWYTTSHSQLVLHSDPTPDDRRHIDLLFKPVHDLKLSTHLGPLTVRRPEPAEMAHIIGDIGRPIAEWEGAFWLEVPSGPGGYVVATSVAAAWYTIEEGEEGVNILADILQSGALPRVIHRLVDTTPEM